MMKYFSSEEIESKKSGYVGAEQSFDEMATSAKQVKEIRKKDALRNIPIVVLTADNFTTIDKIKVNYQDDLASLSDHSKHIIAQNSGHYIQKDKPQVVIDEIEEMVNEIRK